MTMLRNPKLWLVIAAAALVAIVAGPNLGTLLPFLLLAACPISMLVMAGGMARMGRHDNDETTADPADAGHPPADLDELGERVGR